MEVLQRVYSQSLDGFDETWFEKIDRVFEGAGPDRAPAVPRHTPKRWRSAASGGHSGTWQDPTDDRFSWSRGGLYWLIVVGPRGFEPPTHGLGNRCSIP